MLVPRETPLSPVHLKNLYEAGNMGIIIMPPVLTYYNHPKTLEEMTTHIVGKIMDQFDLDGGIYRRWEGVKKNI